MAKNVVKNLIIGLLSVCLWLGVLSMLSGNTSVNNVTDCNHFKARLYGLTQTGTLLVEDEQGNLWELEGLDLREDDLLMITIDDNNTTNNKHDDVVTNVYLLAEPIVQEAEAQD